MSNPTIIQAVNVNYRGKDGELVQLYKGDELPADAPKEIKDALRKQDKERVEALRDLGLPVEDAAPEPSEPDDSSANGEDDYSKLKQPALKALLDERKIEYPSGPVSNAALVELLTAADAAAQSPAG